jgi:glycosyltransferase involved in cell wall biosynthesis
MAAVKVSILIPCFNASEFIEETLRSCLDQDYPSFEIIIIDDGSTDNSKQKISEIKDERIRYFYQHNQGVSAARNLALEKSSGEYVVFFDADDLMTEGFIQERAGILDSQSETSFASGYVTHFKNDKKLTGEFVGVSKNAIEDILLYSPLVSTCPSNYMFRRKFLKAHNLRFDIRLSSTADRLFLLQCVRHGKCSLIGEKGKLLYRISSASMSHQLNRKLALDNESYYSILIELGLIPPDIKRATLYKGYYILAGIFHKTGPLKKTLKYALKALILKPGAFSSNFIKGRLTS